MGIVKFQSLGLLLLIALGAGGVFGIYNNLVEWRHEDKTCFEGLKWHQVVERQQFLSIGYVHLYYVPMTYSCPAGHLFDPLKYRVEYGELVPVAQ